MATTRSSDVDAQIAQLWAKDLFAEAEDLTFWGMFEGTPGSSMPIHRHDDLTKGGADTILFDIVLGLDGAGLTGDGAGSILEGNEEKLRFRQTSLGLTQFQHAVRWTDLAEFLITHEMRTTAKGQLAKWLAAQFDRRTFAEFTGNTKPQGDSSTTIPSANKWASGSATTRDTIADGDATGRLTLAEITRLKAYAQTALRIEPIRMEDGQEYFGLVVHPYTAMSLKINDTTWAQAQREAQVRGDDNPLFTGALGMWDGVILYSSNRVPRSANSGAVQTSDNVFFGAQAMSRGFGFHPKWVEQEFSYGQEAGISTRVLVGEKLNVFDLTDAGGASDANKTAIGSMVVYAAAAAPSQP